VMLTTSLNPDDQERSKQYYAISEFRSKPMSIDMVMEVIKTYFPQNM